MTWTPPTTFAAGADYPYANYASDVLGNLNHLHGELEQPFTNSSSGALVIGDVLVQASDTTVNTTLTVGTPLPVLVATQAVAAGGVGYFAATGFVLVNVASAVAAGDYLQTSATAKKAQTGTTGAFARAVTSSSTQVIARLGSASGGTGTVTSVGISAPGEFIVAGSPVTGSGILTLTKAAAAANTVAAGPVSGASAAWAFRPLDYRDLPGLWAKRFLLAAG